MVYSSIKVRGKNDRHTWFEHNIWCVLRATGNFVFIHFNSIVLMYLFFFCSHWWGPVGLQICQKRYKPTTSQHDFDVEWNLHPPNRRKVKIFGKMFNERRWSQAWGVSMAYSGLEQTAKPIEGSSMVPILLDEVNGLMEGMSKSVNGCDEEFDGTNEPYNACLQNWYEPDDIIGLHSDDEAYLRKLPIFSLSWGGTRRFLFRSRKKDKDDLGKVELWLKDGDLLVMGGTCQNTHKHELPKLRNTMDPLTSNRINWTIRALK